MISALTSEVTCLPMYSVGGALVWTVGERQRLMNAYTKASKEGLLLLFPDRTWSAIMTQASRLRVSRSEKRWVPEEDRLLVELRERGLGWGEASECFTERTPHAIKKRFYRLRKLKKEVSHASSLLMERNEKCSVCI